jgi:hypothetical protein
MIACPPRVSRDRCASGRKSIRHAAEAGEHFQLEELGIVEAQRLRRVAQRGAWVLPPTRLTLVPTSTAGFCPS